MSRELIRSIPYPRKEHMTINDLTNEHLDTARAIGRRYGLQEADAEDAIGDIVLRMAQGELTIDPGADFTAWIEPHILRKAGSMGRARRRRVARFVSLTDLNDSQIPQPEEPLATFDAQDNHLETLLAIKDGDLLLRSATDTNKQLAKEEGCSPKTISRRLKATKAHLALKGKLFT